MPTTIPAFPLLPGVYGLRLSIDVGEIITNIFYAENLLHITVTDNRIQRTNPSCEGFFQVDTEWHIQSSGELNELEAASCRAYEPPFAC